MIEKFKKKLKNIFEEKLIGHIDIIDDHIIAGWVFNQSKPNAAVTFNIFFEDFFLAEITANEFRPDLKGLNMGNGKHGFTYEIPKNIELPLSAKIILVSKVHNKTIILPGTSKKDFNLKNVFRRRVPFNQLPEPVQKIIDSKIFDLNYYNSQFPNNFFGITAAALHFWEFGAKENKLPHFLFDTGLYLHNSPDVKLNNINPLYHYITSGWKENRNPCSTFFSQLYHNQYCHDSKQNPLTHFISTYLNPNQIEQNNSNIELFFDANYYLKENPDVAASKLDPILHFFTFGYKEGRNPNQHFNTLFYKQNNADVANINPFLHYLFFGKKEGRKIKKFIDVNYLKNSISKKLEKWPTPKPVDIILPIYNGYQFVTDLLQNLLQSTTQTYNLIVINDASPDDKIGTLLKTQLKKFKNHKLITNKKNLGFVKSVNLGLAEAKNDVIILNSDTILPNNWLPRLMYPIWTNPKVASVTPFTNAGTIASYPIVLQDNNIFLDLPINQIDSVFEKINPEAYQPCPTGVGFCMAMSKAAIKKIGYFDDESFIKGYGEENDWCRRAAKENFQNVITPNLFVWHKHGGSFTSAEKKQLIDQNTKLLVKKHPEYFHEVQKHISIDGLDPIRFFAIIKHAEIKSGYISKLYIDHRIGGGANIYLDKILDKQKDKKPTLLLSYNFKLHCLQIKFAFQSFEITRYFNTISDVFKFLQLFKFEEIFYNNLVSFRDINEILKNLVLLKEKTKAKLIVTIHDYLPICQSFTLLNNENKYCNAEINPEVCEKCITKNKNYETKEVSIIQWRSDWEKVLEQSTQIICFSNPSKEILLKVYGSNKKIAQAIKVIPHQLPVKIESKPKYSISKDLKIGIIGTINLHKGYEVVKKLVQYLEQNKIGEIFIIGELSPNNIQSEVLTQTGKYHPSELPKLVETLGINVFLFPSIWPETFSFVTSEILEMGSPVVGFDIGAPGERISQSKKGKVIPLNSTPQQIIESLIDLKDIHIEEYKSHLFKKLKTSKLFNEKYYLQTNPDVLEAGIDPMEHYLLFGAFEGRNPSSEFNSSFYLQTYNDIKSSGINPLIHYIDYGKAEGRLVTPPEGYNLFQKNLKLKTDQKIAVLIHGYYHDLIEELLNATLNIPLNHTILISVINHDGEKVVKIWQQKHPKVKVICRTVVNRGRDIAPAFIGFAAELKKFDLVCKIHTKKSLYTGAEQTTWRKQLVNNLLGSKIIVENIIYLFQQNPKLGMVYPYSKLLPYWAYTWLSNKPIAFSLQNKLEVPLQISGYTDYPMGSMFWFKPNALKQLHNNTLSIEDFKEEPCGNDGTFAHAIERAFVDIVKHNGFEYAEVNFEDHSYAPNFGTKNFYQYTQKTEEELISKVSQYKIISFDIFDTLLTRKVFNPDEIMHMVEQNINHEFKLKSNFFELRKKAESEARQTLNKDVSFTEIYEAFRKFSILDEKVVNHAQNLEMEFELLHLLPRYSMLKVYNYCKNQGKQIWLTSDMYLEQSFLEKILDKNGITGFHKLWVSNNLNARKDTGKMWEFLLNNEIKNKSEFIHIGDNEQSDIQQTIDLGLAHYHIMSGHNLFHNSKVGLNYKSQFPNWIKHKYLGLLVSKLFNSPFVRENQNSLLPKTFTSPHETGYIAYGPVVMSFLLWMTKQAKAKKINQLFFLAREGYFLKQCFDVLANQPIFKQEFGSHLESKYLLTSRRAVMGAVDKSEKILTDILTNNSFQGSLKDFLWHRLGVDISPKKYPIVNKKIDLPKEYEEVNELLKDLMPYLNQNTKLEQSSLLQYLQENNFFSKNQVGLVDVGYSGTIQKFLYEITKQPMAGFYFVTKEVTGNFTHSKNSTIGFFENNAKPNSQTPILKFNLYLEFWLTSNQGQLLNFKSNSLGVEPQFKQVEPAKVLFKTNEEIYQGCIQFIKDACSLVSNNFEELGLNEQTAPYFFELAVREDLWDDLTRKIAFLEDDFCGNQENLNVIEDYKKYVL